MTVAPPQKNHTPNPDPTEAARLWWRKNWKIVVLLSVGVPSLTCAVGMFLGLNSIRDTEIYQMGWQRVREHPEVMLVLGTPVEEAFLALGGVETPDANDTAAAGADQVANILFNIKGPKGNGSVAFKAVQREGQWHMTFLRVAAYVGDSEHDIVIVDELTPKEVDDVGEVEAEGEPE